MSKAKIVLTVLLALGVAVVGVGTVALSANGTPPKQVRPEEPPKKAQAPTDGETLPAGVVARLGSMRWRHEGEAGSLAFSPDGKTVAATSQAGLISLWETATGRPLGRIPDKDLGPNAVATGPLAFSPDGKRLAWQSPEAVHIWDRARGEVAHRLPHSERGPGLSVLHFSPDGKLLARGGSGKTLVWDVAEGKQVHALGEVSTSTPGLAFSPDGKTLALASQNPSVQLWDLTTGQMVRGIKVPDKVNADQRFAMAVAFSPDGKRLASAGRESIVISDPADGKELARWPKARDWMLTLAFTPDGQTLIGGDEAAKIYVWDAADGKELRVIGGGEIGRSVALSPDGKTVARGAAGSLLRLWDVATGKELFPNEEGHTAPVYAAAFSPDGRQLATGGSYGHIHLWDPATGRHVRRLKGSGAAAVDFSPDGARLATVWTWDRTIRIWDVGRGEEVVKWTHEGCDEVPAVAFSASGQSVVSISWTKPQAQKSAGTSRVHVWDAAGGKSQREILIEDFRALGLVVAPDGRLAAVSGGWGGVWLCDVERGRTVLQLRGHENQVIAAAFSPDGQTLVTGSHDKTLRLWETVTGQEIRVLRGHEEPVTAVVYSPDGRLLASSSGERYGSRPDVRLWDAATGKELARLEGQDSVATALTFSPDGRRLATGHRNGTVLVWDLTDRRAAALAARDFGAKDLADLWSDLAGADAGKAHQAAWALAASPGVSIPFLKEQVQPIPAADPKQVQRWLADLDSEDFPTRDAATRELKLVSDQIEPTLRGVLEGKPSNETRRRVETILTELDVPSGDRLRGLRAVRALEMIGTSEVGQVLRTLAAGPAEARLTREAKAALERMARRAIRP